MRTICFNANDEHSNKATNHEELRQTNYADSSFNTFTVLSAFLGLASLVAILAVALFKSDKNNKTYKNKLSVLNEKNSE